MVCGLRPHTISFIMNLAACGREIHYKEPNFSKYKVKSEGISRVQEWALPEAGERDIRLLVKRDDELHPEVSGNKWRKMKYNIAAARELGYKAMLTFGGAYSNHLAAVAAAGRLLGWKTLGFVRGEPTEPLNPTLSFARQCGMELRYSDRATYRNLRKGEEMEEWKQAYYILPEGGSNDLAVKGCAEVAAEVDFQPDFCCVAAGTGATAAGLIRGFSPQTRVLAFPVLKGGFMKEEIQGFLGREYPNWQVADGYHFGGYARFSQPLIDFINHTKASCGIPLDPVYTGKLFFGVADLIKKDFFPEGSTVLLLHTGGLQGIAGFNQRFPNHPIT